MSDPKQGAKPETKPAAQEQASAPAQYVAIGRLRRDLLIIGQGTQAEVQALAKAAVSEGRAAEVHVIRSLGFFSESAIRWDADAIDTPRANPSAESDSGPLLNVHPSAAKSVAKAAEGKSELEPTTVQAERAKAEEASKTTADLVDGHEAQVKAETKAS